MPFWIRIAIFLLVIILLITAINRFVFRAVSGAFNLSKAQRSVFRGLLIASVVALIGARLLLRVIGPDVSRALGYFGSTIQLAVIFAGALLAVQWACTFTLSFVKKALAKKALPTDPSVKTNGSEIEACPKNAVRLVSSTPTGESGVTDAVAIKRRTFLAKASAGAAIGLGGSASLYGAIWGRHDFVVEEVPIALPRLPRTLVGFTIVQLSDIHLGTYIGESEILSALMLVKMAKADLIVLTGDLLDHDSAYAPLLGTMTRRLSEIAPVAAIVGNHDYYAGVGATISALEQGGADVLVNRAKLIGDAGGRFALVGVDDLWARRFGVARGPDIVRAVKQIPKDVPRVLLCHNPAYFPEAAPHVDLQLSGHTHGGQVNPGVRVADLVLPFGYVAGRYRRADSELYVNRGFGTAGPPIRIGAPPEVTKIVLV